MGYLVFFYWILVIFYGIFSECCGLFNECHGIFSECYVMGYSVNVMADSDIFSDLFIGY